MLLNVIQELRLNGPPEEVQFSDCGKEGLVRRNLEENTLTTTVRVEVLLGVRLQLGLVAHVDEKLVTVEWVTDEVATAVVGHEPVNQTQGKVGGALEIREDSLDVFAICVEFLEG